MMKTESITNYMATKLITFKPSTPIKEAMNIIVKKKISGAPVVDASGRLVGLLSEKDCLKAVLEGPYNQRPSMLGNVGEYMSTNVRTMHPDKSVMDVAIEFAHSQYKRFPVVENGRLLGQISRVDILTAILKISPELKLVPDSWKPRVPV